MPPRCKAAARAPCEALSSLAPLSSENPSAMSTTLSSGAVPTLPQNDAADAQAARAFQLAYARTDYNYMRSYLDAVPMSADLPDGEKFGLDFIAQVLQVF